MTRLHCTAEAFYCCPDCKKKKKCTPSQHRGLDRCHSSQAFSLGMKGTGHSIVHLPLLVSVCGKLLEAFSSLHSRTRMHHSGDCVSKNGEHENIFECTTSKRGLPSFESGAYARICNRGRRLVSAASSWMNC